MVSSLQGVLIRGVHSTVVSSLQGVLIRGVHSIADTIGISPFFIYRVQLVKKSVSEETRPVEPSRLGKKSFIDIGRDEVEEEVDGVIPPDGPNYYNLGTIPVGHVTGT